MAWTDYARTDLAGNDSLPTGVGAWLVERERLASEIPVAVEFTDQTTTSATLVNLTTFEVTTPDYGAGTFYFYLQPDVYVSAGTGAFLVKTSTKTGDEISVTNTGSFDDATSGSKFQLEAANTTYTVTVQGKVDGGNTLHVQMVDRMTAWIAGS